MVKLWTAGTKCEIVCGRSSRSTNVSERRCFGIIGRNCTSWIKAFIRLRIQREFALL